MSKNESRLIKTRKSVSNQKLSGRLANGRILSNKSQTMAKQQQPTHWVFSQNFSSPTLTVWDHQFLEDSERKDH